MTGQAHSEGGGVLEAHARLRREGRRAPQRLGAPVQCPQLEIPQPRLEMRDGGGGIRTRIVTAAGKLLDAFAARREGRTDLRRPGMPRGAEGAAPGGAVGLWRRGGASNLEVQPRLPWVAFR